MSIHVDTYLLNQATRISRPPQAVVQRSHWRTSEDCIEHCRDIWCFTDSVAGPGQRQHQVERTVTTNRTSYFILDDKLLLDVVGKGAWLHRGQVFDFSVHETYAVSKQKVVKSTIGIAYSVMFSNSSAFSVSTAAAIYLLLDLLALCIISNTMTRITSLAHAIRPKSDDINPF
jgi:hypothetical protein